jgi:hypothetical protein
LAPTSPRLTDCIATVSGCSGSATPVITTSRIHGRAGTRQEHHGLSPIGKQAVAKLIAWASSSTSPS